jgi:hypothetical protein
VAWAVGGCLVGPTANFVVNSVASFVAYLSASCVVIDGSHFVGVATDCSCFVGAVATDY